MDPYHLGYHRILCLYLWFYPFLYLLVFLLLLSHINLVPSSFPFWAPTVLPVVFNVEDMLTRIFIESCIGIGIAFVSEGLPLVFIILEGELPHGFNAAIPN